MPPARSCSCARPPTPTPPARPSEPTATSSAPADTARARRPADRPKTSHQAKPHHNRAPTRKSASDMWGRRANPAIEIRKK
jgi:hypothetical protein